ncbi:MAG: alpha/beta fold hydrolase [Candidatus Schekmanbacteria bacterium]|nr:alpha/beta fold hydrolase [Candidatus Schekmanbacteria bacterium]
MFDERVSLKKDSLDIALNIDGIISYPENGKCTKSACIFPPHPKLGGDIDNNVVKAISELLVSNSFFTGRFNYRGVGKSDMEVSGISLYDYWSALDARGDFSSIISDSQFTTREIMRLSGTESVAIAGYSFGTMIAAELCRQEYVSSCVLISPPVSIYDYSCLSGFNGKILFIVAENDLGVTKEETLALMEKLGLNGTLELIPGEDHFYRGSEEKICEFISKFICS